MNSDCGRHVRCWHERPIAVYFAGTTLWCSIGGDSAVKEPGHFEVRKSSSQVIRMMHLILKKVDDHFFSCRPQNTGRQRRFIVKIKQIKRSDTITFLFYVHTITEAKQYAGRSQGLSQGGGSSSEVIWLGVPWCSAVIVVQCQTGKYWHDTTRHVHDTTSVHGPYSRLTFLTPVNTGTRENG